MKQSRLKYPQFLRLVDLLRSRAEKIIAERPTLESLAAELGKEVGHDLTAGNIRTVTDSIGLKWQAKRHRMNGCAVKRPASILARAVLEVAAALDLSLAEKDALVMMAESKGA